MQIVRDDRRYVADHGVRGVEAILDTHLLLGRRSPKVLTTIDFAISIQHGANIPDHLSGVGIVVVERVCPEDHASTAGEELLHNLPADGQRVDTAVSERALPGWGVQHRWLLDQADGSAGRADQLHLRAPNDLELFRRDA